MDSIISRSYRMTEPTRDKLYRYGFKFVSEDEDGVYFTYKFKNLNLDCNINAALPSGQITIGVRNNGNLYAAFYNPDLCYNNKVIKQLNEGFLNNFKRFHITEEVA